VPAGQDLFLAAPSEYAAFILEETPNRFLAHCPHLRNFRNGIVLFEREGFKGFSLNWLLAGEFNSHVSPLHGESGSPTASRVSS
jgi:hypothetical protein